jgi:hypothetical protein
MIDAAHQGAVMIGTHLDHLAGATLVAAGEHDHLVALADLRCHHSTSGASEMIFMWFLARNSRGNRSEDAGADRLHLRIDQHRGIAIEADDRTVGRLMSFEIRTTTAFITSPFLHAPARNGLLHRHHDDVADGGVFALRAAQHLDAHDAARAGIVRHVEVGLHLNHDATLVLFEFHAHGAHTTFFFSPRMTSHRLSLESGRRSSIQTMSSTWYSLVASWA